jgi:spore coat protein U-like protein
VPVRRTLAASGALLLAIGVAGSPSPAEALACTATFTSVNFGSVDLLAGGAITATGSVHIACTAIGLAGVSVCPYLGMGTGGQDSSGRFLQGPTSLRYQLYRDSGHSQVWGDPSVGFGGAAELLSATGNLLGTGTASWDRTIYARIAAGEPPVPAGSYTSTFAGADVNFLYGPSLLVLNCTSLSGLLNQQITPANSLAVAATVDKDCILTVSPLDFGSRGVLTTETTASTPLTVRCTPDAAYTIALGNGLNGTGPTDRRMRLGATANYVTYGLYKDGGATDPWGDSGGNRVSGTGSGGDQSVTVHGKVPAQTTPAAGTYNDTVVVTVEY